MKNIYALLFSMAIYFNAQGQVPYAWYPLNGNAIDSSGNGLNGTLHGSPTPTTNRFNQPNMALNFNGSNQYIDLPSTFDFPNRTIVAWFNATQISGTHVIYSSDYASIQYGQTKMIVFNNNALDMQVQADQTMYDATVNINSWFQLAITRSSATVGIYVNGVKVYQGLTPNNLHSDNGVGNATVGCDRGHSALFNGKIDDLRIYNSVLTDQQIQNLYSPSPCSVYDSVVIVADTATMIIRDTVHYSTMDTLIINTNLTGINPPNNTNTIKVYPNPASDQICINTGNYALMAGYHIKIVDMLGQDAYASIINQQLFNISLAGWSNGTYVLEIYDNTNALIETKFIIVE